MHELRFIDDFSLEDVTRALRSLSPSDKARVLVKSHASAANRALSRLELSRHVGSESVNTCNGVYGTFAKNLAMALDPALAKEWKPSNGPTHDWVMFLSFGPRRWMPPSEGERDPWVFVLRETLARALDAVGWAPYTQIEPEVQVMLEEAYGDGEGDDLWQPTDFLDEIASAEEELAALNETEREAVVLARIGQGSFRQRVIEAWNGRCAVTGASFLPALVASHIKSWVQCTNEERLDASNGLLLVGTLDRLFDGGFISFDVEGRILLSPVLPHEECEVLGVTRELRLRHVPATSIPYLIEHRRDCFLEMDDASVTE